MGNFIQTLGILELIQAFTTLLCSLVGVIEFLFGPAVVMLMTVLANQRKGYERRGGGPLIS